MKYEQYKEIVDARIKHIQELMVVKAKEYSIDGDMLYNFHEGARMKNISPAEVLDGFLLKHLISINDMINGKRKVTEKMIDEKISDYLVYGLLLECIFKEKLYSGKEYKSMLEHESKHDVLTEAEKNSKYYQDRIYKFTKEYNEEIEKLKIHEQESPDAFRMSMPDPEFTKLFNDGFQKGIGAKYMELQKEIDIIDQKAFKNMVDINGDKIEPYIPQDSITKQSLEENSDEIVDIIEDELKSQIEYANKLKEFLKEHIKPKGQEIPKFHQETLNLQQSFQDGSITKEEVIDKLNYYHRVCCTDNPLPTIAPYKSQEISEKI